MKVVIAQCDTLPPALPAATAAALTDSLVLNQSGTMRTATLAVILEALMGVSLTPTAVTVGTSYAQALAPVPTTPARKALAIQNTSPSAGVFVFFGATAPLDDTHSWQLGPGQSYPPAGVTAVSQDGIWLRATAAGTPVVIEVG